MSESKQLIIVRKDLNMSAGKLAVQVSHASFEFIRKELVTNGTTCHYPEYVRITHFDIPNDWFFWACGDHTKIVCEAKNLNKLLKVREYAKAEFLTEGLDYFFIKDLCRTELTPENDDGTTITCVGFAPMSEERLKNISSHYQLYKG